MKKRIQAIECDLCKKRWIMEDPKTKQKKDFTVNFRGTITSYRDLCDNCYDKLVDALSLIIY